MLIRMCLCVMLSSMLWAQDNDRVEFFDDFSNGTDAWDLLGQDKVETWKIENVGEPHGKALHQFKNYGKPHGTVRSAFNIALIKAHSMGDFTLEADVKSTKKNYPHRDVCLIFGYQDADHFYYVHMGKKTDKVSNRIMIVNGKPRKSLGKPDGAGTRWTNRWHKVKLVRSVADGTITVYFDDMDKPHMQLKDKTFVWGKVGLGSFDDTAMWDNVRLTGTSRKAE